MTIKKIDDSEYYINFSKFTSGVCDSFVKRILLEGNGVMLGCYENEEPIGVSVLGMKQNDRCIIYYVDVKEEYMNKGVGQKLIEESIREAKTAGKRLVECDVIVENSFSDVIRHILDKKKFVETQTFSSYKCFTNEPTKKSWDEFMEEKGKRIIERAERRGFICKQFDKIDKNTFDFFKHSLKKIFPYDFDPFSIYNQLVQSLSFLTVREKTPVAYLSARLINEQPLIVEVSHMAVSEKHKNTYAFSTTLLNFITKSFENKDSSIIFCVDNQNEEMIRSTKRFLTNVISTTKRQIVYEKTI